MAKQSDTSSLIQTYWPIQAIIIQYNTIIQNNIIQYNNDTSSLTLTLGGVCNDGTRAGYFHDTNVTKQGKKVKHLIPERSFSKNIRIKYEIWFYHDFDNCKIPVPWCSGACNAPWWQFVRFSGDLS